MGLLEVPGAGRHRGRLGALRGAGATAAQGGQAGGQRLVDLRRREEVHVGVEAAGGEDLALAGDHVGARSDDQVGSTPSAMSGLPLRPMPGDPARPDADVGPDDAPVVHDHHVGDHRVQRALGRGGEALVHRLADRLAATEDRLLAAEGEILLDLDPQVGVPQPDLVPGGGTEDRRVRLPVEPGHQVQAALEARSGCPAPTGGPSGRRSPPYARPPARSGSKCPPGCPAGSPAAAAVEVQARIDVGQVDVRADLDRPVRRVGEGELARSSGPRSALISNSPG